MRALGTIFVAFIATAISAEPALDCDGLKGQTCSAATELGCCDPGEASEFLYCDPWSKTLMVADMPYHQLCNQQPQPQK